MCTKADGDSRLTALSLLSNPPFLENWYRFLPLRCFSSSLASLCTCPCLSPVSRAAFFSARIPRPARRVIFTIRVYYRAPLCRWPARTQLKASSPGSSSGVCAFVTAHILFPVNPVTLRRALTRTRRCRGLIDQL